MTTMSINERSAASLRDTLFQTIDDLRAGKIDVAHANAVTKAAEAIVKSVDMQIAFERLRIESKVPAMLPAMHLVPKLPRAEK